GKTTASARAAGAQERKVVTVLFCDFVGFTPDVGRSDPEEVLARSRPYLAKAREVISRYEGRVEKSIGDALVAVFGVPRVHEDDPERAVRAGLAIIEAATQLNEEKRLGVQARVGIE